MGIDTLKDVRRKTDKLGDYLPPAWPRRRY
jgi:hypothetical protein